jgi:hypothetical protein
MNVNIKLPNILILPVVLYECEALCFILWEEHRLRVFEHGLLRRIYGPGGWGTSGRGNIV